MRLATTTAEHLSGTSHAATTQNLSKTLLISGVGATQNALKCVQKATMFLAQCREQGTETNAHY